MKLFEDKEHLDNLEVTMRALRREKNLANIRVNKLSLLCGDSKSSCNDDAQKIVKAKINCKTISRAYDSEEYEYDICKESFDEDVILAVRVPKRYRDKASVGINQYEDAVHIYFGDEESDSPGHSRGHYVLNLHKNSLFCHEVDGPMSEDGKVEKGSINFFYDFSLPCRDEEDDEDDKNDDNFDDFDNPDDMDNDDDDD